MTKPTKKVNNINNNSNNKLLISMFVWILYIVWLLKISSTQLTIVNVITHIIFAGILVGLYWNDLKAYWKNFKSNKKKNIKSVILYLVIILVLLFASNILITAISSMMGGSFDSDSSTKIISTVFKKVPFGTMFVMFLMIIFYPIVEELVFRKSLRDVIKNPIIFIIISSLITWYFQVTLVNPQISEFVLSLSVFFNSIVSAIIFVKKDNILFSIFPRMLYNIIICAVQLIGLFQ